MDDKDFSYRSLIVWQKAMQFAKIVYVVIDTFPPAEKFALSDQIRRAVVSIPSNIAEGNGRGSNKDYAHFLSIARGSLYETMTQLRIAKDLGYLDDYSQFEDIAAEVGRMLGAMLKKYGSIHCSPSP